MVRTPVFTVDRAGISVDQLAEMIADNLMGGDIVHVTDSRWPACERLRYILQWTRDAYRVFDGLGRSLGVFADLDALVQHAERMSA